MRQEHLLDEADVGSMFKHERGHGVAEQVAAAALADVGGNEIGAGVLGFGRDSAGQGVAVDAVLALPDLAAAGSRSRMRRGSYVTLAVQARRDPRHLQARGVKRILAQRTAAVAVGGRQPPAAPRSVSARQG